MIAGPTGVGKTDLSVRLAKHFNSEIISADSRQFYREMNIGTAKPTAKQLSEIPHHFINNKSVEELYGAGHYEKDVISLMEKLFESNNILFLVGGSGLYINALLNGVDEFAEIPSELRNKLISDYKNQGIKWLQEEVKKVDPDFFSSADTNNPQRMMRSLEVFLHTQKPYSTFLKNKKAERNFTPVKILINTTRENIYNQINRRTDQMIQNGWLEEAKKLLPFKSMNALKTVGYRELFQYLENEITFKTAVEKIKQHTRNYAKRQLTWFKNQDDFEEFSPDDFEKISSFISVITYGGKI